GYRSVGCLSCRLEDVDQFVLQQPLRVAVLVGEADVVELEERRSGDELAVADGGDEGDAPVDEGESGGVAGGDDHAGDVDQLASAAVGAGGDRRDPTRLEQRYAAGEDVGEPCGELVVAAVGEVGPVVSVAVVDFGYPAAASGVLAHVPVRGGPIRRRGDHQRHRAAQLFGE